VQKWSYYFSKLVLLCLFFVLVQIEKEKYNKLCAMTFISSGRGRAHKGRGLTTISAAAAALRGEKKASNQNSPMPVSHSEDVSSDGYDSDSSSVDSNDSEDDEGSNGSNSKASLNSAPPIRPRAPSSRKTVSGYIGVDLAGSRECYFRSGSIVLLTMHV